MSAIRRHLACLGMAIWVLAFALGPGPRTLAHTPQASSARGPTVEGLAPGHESTLESAAASETDARVEEQDGDGPPHLGLTAALAHGPSLAPATPERLASASGLSGLARGPPSETKV